MWVDRPMHRCKLSIIHVVIVKTLETLPSIAHLYVDKMLKYVWLTFVLVCVCQASIDFVHKKEHHNHDGAVFKALRFMKDGVQNELSKLKHRVTTNFGWSNCGSSGDLASISSLNVAPDPIHIPGDLTVSFNGSLKQQVTAPVQLSLEIKKKEIFWIPVPCIDNLGSCDYSDICPLLRQFQCPPVFKKHNIPCQCPFKRGGYTLPPSSIQIDSTFGIPSWLEDGDFKVSATMKAGGKRIFCININFKLG